MIMMSLDEGEGCSDSRTPKEHSRPTPLKHLPGGEAPALTTPTFPLPAHRRLAENARCWEGEHMARGFCIVLDKSHIHQLDSIRLRAQAHVQGV